MAKPDESAVLRVLLKEWESPEGEGRLLLELDAPGLDPVIKALLIGLDEVRALVLGGHLSASGALRAFQQEVSIASTAMSRRKGPQRPRKAS